uniref:Uncharacterized protein n=1 Tax=Cannabis sativa TaxID=3483 RepID=A0A803QKD0_CANSA
MRLEQRSTPNMDQTQANLTQRNHREGYSGRNSKSIHNSKGKLKNGGRRPSAGRGRRNHPVSTKSVTRLVMLHTNATIDMIKITLKWLIPKAIIKVLKKNLLKHSLHIQPISMQELTGTLTVVLLTMSPMTQTR